jgi:hypothetical protein
MYGSICRRVSPLALVFAASLLIPTVPAAAKEDSAGSDWLEEALAEEARGLRFRKVELDDGAYRFRMGGKPEEPQAFEGGWFILSDVGASTPVECYVFKEFGDFASTIVTLTDLNIETTVEANSGTLAGRAISDIDSGVIDGSPYLSMSALYTMDSERGKLVGMTKSSVTVKNNRMLACTHNDVGYTETFARIFDKFVSSAKLPEVERSPYFEEIFLTEVNGSRVGFAHVRYFTDEGADPEAGGAFDTRIERLTSMLVPVSADAVNSDDSSTVTWSRPDGTIINAYSASSENGEVITDLQLRRNEYGDWVSYGTFRGEEFEKILGTGVEPLSDMGQSRVASALLESPDSIAEFPLWNAGADPSQFLAGKITLDDNADKGSALVEVGSVRMQTEFDDKGRLKYGSIQQGGASLMLSRTWTRGNPELGYR